MKTNPPLTRNELNPLTPLLRCLVAALVFCLLASGCQNPTFTRIVTTVGGAVVGAGGGYLAGGEKGAIIGGLAGGAAGFAVGQLIYDKQKDLETRKQVLAASVADEAW